MADQGDTNDRIEALENEVALLKQVLKETLRQVRQLSTAAYSPGISQSAASSFFEMETDRIIGKLN